MSSFLNLYWKLYTTNEKGTNVTKKQALDVSSFLIMSFLTRYSTVQLCATL